jgi:hypothetical protein
MNRKRAENPFNTLAVDVLPASVVVVPVVLNAVGKTKPGASFEQARALGRHVLSM